jgi:hypothetical protein
MPPSLQPAARYRRPRLETIQMAVDKGWLARHESGTYVHAARNAAPLWVGGLNGAAP